MAGELKERSIRVATTLPEGRELPWSGYPGHLSQVLISLFQNTLRHAYKPEESGQVDVRISERGSSYRIELSDYGAGVPPHILPRIFEPFVTSGRDAKAAGLGLAISHNIVTNVLGGEIVCSSAPAKGTRIQLTIPRVCPRNEEPPPGRTTLTPGPREER
jgi:signal transduction histidine kinase